LDKNNLRFRVIGAIDELNSWLGLAKSLTEDKKLRKILQTRQEDLFEVSSELAKGRAKKKFSLRKVRKLEKEIALWQKDLPRLKSFIFPGGSQLSALLHLGRTVCRRVEQELVGLSREEETNKNVLEYFNRLSDWLFVLARKVNQEREVKEETWKTSR
jgi:cob(I)alamin adenosyltransferase